MKDNLLVSRKKIEWIAHNYELTTHAKDRIKERTQTKNTIRELILYSPLAWKSNNDIFICFNLYEYIVVSIDTIDGKEVPKIKTLLNLRNEKNNVVDKFMKEYKKQQKEKFYD